MVHPPNLRRSTLSGIAIMSGQTVLTKAAAIGSQIVLAWLLSEEAFGLIGIVLAVSLLAEVLKDGGVRDVLVQCGDRWDHLVTPAFWLAATLALASAVLIMAASAPVADFYDAPVLRHLLWFMAAEALINGLAAVPSARLQRSMRFRDLAVGEAVFQVGIAGGAVACAAAGAGVFSFVIPRPAMALLRAVWLWHRARPRVGRTLQVRRWPRILKESWYLIAITLLYRLYAQADYLVLAMFVTKPQVGLYYFAFVLSIQFVALLSTNLGTVFFPAFTSIRDDPARRRLAFSRSCTTVMAVGLPLVALQAACADAGVRAVFQPRWYDAIPLIELLSLGLGFRLAGGMAQSLLKSGGHFRALFWLTLVSSLSAVALVYVVARAGGGTVGVAAAMSAWSVLFGIASLAVGFRFGGDRLGQVARVYARPLAVAVLAVAPWVLLDRGVLVGLGASPWLRLVLTASGGLFSIVVLSRLLNPVACGQLVSALDLGRVARSLFRRTPKEA